MLRGARRDEKDFLHLSVLGVLSPHRSPVGEEMPSDEWIRILADGGRVKFTNQELADDCVFITAQVEGNKVVYSVVLTNTENPLSRKEVESHFEGELQRRSNPATI